MLSSSVFCVCSERHWCVVTIRATDLSREAQTQMPCARHTKKSQKEKKFSNEISTIELTVPLNSTLSLIDLFLDLHFSGKTIIHPPFLAEIDNCQRNIHRKKKNTRQEERKAQKACVLVFDTRRDVIICYLCLLNVTIPYIQPNVDCHILHTSQPHRTETHTNSGYLRFTQRFSSKAERT